MVSRCQFSALILSASCACDSAQRGFRGFPLVQELLAIQAGDDHAFLHGVAFVDGALDQTAGGLEGDVHLGQFDIAGDQDAIRGLRTQRAVGQHAGRTQNGNNYHGENYFFHVREFLFYWIMRRTFPMARPRSMRATL